MKTMPFKDKEKEREWRKAYREAHRDMYRAISRRYAEKNREKMREYAKKYNASTEGKAYRAEYYLKNREEILKANKLNHILKRHKTTPATASKHRTTSRKYARRRKAGIVIDRNAQGFFWKAGKLWNGYFNYKKEAIKDAEKAFCL